MVVLDVRDLDLRHLQALDAVVRTGTFGRAAAQLGYTQSAVSQQVAALERLVGEPVFDRPGGPRPPVLTPVGRVLLDEARDLLSRAERAVTAVRRFQDGEAGRLAVGSFESVSTAVVPDVLAVLRAERPGLEVALVEEDEDDVLVRRVLDGELDVTFLSVEPSPPLVGHDLFADPMVVVARPGDVGDGPVPSSVLQAAPLITGIGSSCRRVVDDALLAAGVRPEFALTTRDNSAVAAMVRAGMGLGVLPRLCVDPEDPRTVVRPIDSPVAHRHVHLAWHGGRTAGPTALRFVELAVEATAALRERVPSDS